MTHFDPDEFSAALDAAHADDLKKVMVERIIKNWTRGLLTNEEFVAEVLTVVYPPATSDEEKLYLVCRQCGEAFDEIGTAASHEPGTCGSDQGFDILPESEAL